MIENRKNTWETRTNSVMYCFVHLSGKTFPLYNVNLNKIRLRDPTILLSLVFCLSYFPPPLSRLSHLPNYVNFNSISPSLASSTAENDLSTLSSQLSRGMQCGQKPAD